MPKTPANDKAEAIAEACAYLNNFSLPNVNDLVNQIADLVAMAEAVDRNHFNGSGWLTSDPRVRRAAQSVRDYQH